MAQVPFHHLQDLEAEMVASCDHWQSLLQEENNVQGRQSRRILAELQQARDFFQRLLPILRTAREDFSQTHREQQRVSTLLEVSQLVNSTLKLEDLLQIVIDRAIAVTGAERGFLMLRDEGSGNLHFAVARNMRRQDIEESSFQVSRSIVNRVAEEGEPILSDNASEDPRFTDSVSIITYVLRSILCVPLLVKNRIIGVLYVDNRVRIGHFVPDDLDMLTAFANQAAVAIENARLFEHVCVLDRLKGDFLESVSHELRSPLTSLNVGLELVGGSVQGTGSELFEVVFDSARRLTQVVENLTRFSEIEREGTAWVFTEEAGRPLPLRELLSEAIEPLRERAETKSLVLNLVIEGDLVSLPIPWGAIRALGEILTNAVSYTERGVIFITARRSGKEVLISVADTGIGIPADEIPYIFDKLFRGRQVRALARTQGLGLGLAVARWVIQAMDGRIWVESVEGKGSVFTMALPLKQDAEGWQVKVPKGQEKAAP